MSLIKLCCCVCRAAAARRLEVTQHASRTSDERVGGIWTRPNAKSKVRVVRAASRELVFVLIASVQFGLQISWFEAFGTLSSAENRRVESFAPRGTDSAQKSQA